MSESDNIAGGQQRPATGAGEYNRLAFVVQQALGKIQTATLVQIVAVTNTGGVSPVGLVDVSPLVNQLDSEGRPTQHGTVHNVPYFRLQGGANAIIMDPQVGDIGICLFASRDISKVKSTKKRANPGSFRQFSYSDGLYVGGVLNGTPSQFVQFSAEGITIKSPTAVKLDAPSVTVQAQTIAINASTSTTITTPTFTVNGATVLAGTVSQTGGGTSSFSGDLTAAGKSVSTHTHGGVQPGAGSTGAPQ